MKIFYARVSTEEQNEIRQTAEAEKSSYDRVYLDKKSGKNTDRPALKRMLDILREGDSVTVLSIDRLGRNTKDILDIVEQLKSKGVNLICLSPNFDTSNMFGEFFLTILSGLAELESLPILHKDVLAIDEMKDSVLNAVKECFND